jgi:hypothetical protein
LASSSKNRDDVVVLAAFLLVLCNYGFRKGFSRAAVPRAYWNVNLWGYRLDGKFGGIDQIGPR